MDKSTLPKMHPGKVIPAKKTKAGAMDDNAAKRIKKRKDMLKEAAGN
jgi:hypothetical protein